MIDRLSRRTLQHRTGTLFRIVAFFEHGAVNVHAAGRGSSPANRSSDGVWPSTSVQGAKSDAAAHCSSENRNPPAAPVFIPRERFQHERPGSTGWYAVKPA